MSDSRQFINKAPNSFGPRPTPSSELEQDVEAQSPAIQAGFENSAAAPFNLDIEQIPLFPPESSAYPAQTSAESEQGEAQAQEQQLLAFANHLTWLEGIIDGQFPQITAEEARETLRDTGFLEWLNIARAPIAEDLLRYALDEADDAPWGNHPENQSTDQEKIAPDRDFGIDSDIAKAIVASNQFREPSKEKIDEMIEESKQQIENLSQGDRLFISDTYDVDFNYRDDRLALENFGNLGLAFGIGSAGIEEMKVKIEIVRPNDLWVWYQATVTGIVHDFYDFNRPTNPGDVAEHFTHYGFTAQEGGTLAVYDFHINIEETFSGQANIPIKGFQ